MRAFSSGQRCCMALLQDTSKPRQPVLVTSHLATDQPRIQILQFAGDRVVAVHGVVERFDRGHLGRGAGEEHFVGREPVGQHDWPAESGNAVAMESVYSYV